MTIEFRCSACDQMLRVPDGAAGKQARCPKCQALMSIPASGSGFAPLSNAPLGDFGRSQAPPPVVPPAAQSTEIPPPAPLPTGPKSDLERQLDFLKQGMTPGAPAQASPNPFAEGPRPTKDYSTASTPFAGTAKGEINPYASPPALGQTAYAPQFDTEGRIGLPWEANGQGVNTWIETTGLLISDSASAFRRMWPDRGLPVALSYWFVGILLGVAGGIFWQLVMEGIASLENPADFGEVMMEKGIEALLALVFLPILSVIMLFVQSILMHGILHLLGGANRDYITTLRVSAYSQGAISWLQIVPCVGGCIVLVMFLVVTINGLTSAHQTTPGKAAAAVLLTLLILVGCLVALVAGLIALFAGLADF